MKNDPSDSPTAGGKARRFRVSIPGLVWELFLVTLIYGAPRLQVIYADYGVDLPGPTLLVLQSSQWVIALAAMLLVLLGVVWVLQDALSTRSETKGSRTGSILLLACPLLLLPTTLIALGLTILDIARRLRG